MGGLPDVLFIIDTNKEAIAVEEGVKLGIPVIAVVDSNSDPDRITFPIPGNDDAIRSISLYCDLVARAVLDGLQQEAVASGKDLGAQAEAEVEVPAAPEPAEKEKAEAEEATRGGVKVQTVRRRRAERPAETGAAG
jgi:small subunit ribosomal protein S2